MDVFGTAAVLFMALVAVQVAFWPGADDPNWELRWRALDPEYRNWLAAMATSYKWLATLEDPEEAELAEGAARRESRRQAYLDLIAAALLIFGLALVLAGFLPGSDLAFAVTVTVLAHSVGTFLRNHAIRRRLAEKSDSEAAPPRPLSARA